MNAGDMSHLRQPILAGVGAILFDARLSVAGFNPPKLVTLGNVPFGKPAPNGYLRAARACGVTLLRPWRWTALAAARAAGVVVVAVGGRTVLT